ncbi:MAG: signal transduction protein [Oscillatoriales cyanobacterium CG2_30_44_21]|nr:MAG: signal transduction protein [Oscillatoriales cyanobacterium CG2_30_44_21]
MFPQKFLAKLAQNHQLSADQERVFLLRFSENRDDREVANLLEISEEAYRKRMGEIYRKFDIGGKGPGKNNRLFHAIQNQLEAETVVTANLANNSSEAKSSVNYIPNFSNLPDHFDEELVLQIRDRSRQIIQERCATMRVLDMSHPLNLEEIYTGTDLLEKITGRRRLGMSELLATYQSGDRLGIAINENRVSSIEALSRNKKIMLLGKPGAGKTTLLKFTALKCSQGEFSSDLVPIFVTLRQYAGMDSQPSILDYVIEDLHSHDIAKPLEIKQLLIHGRAILFWDGLDEVRESDLHRVLEDLRSFSEKYYNNRFIITSRLGAQEYIFEKFTEFELANFQPLQISHFTKRWFAENSRHVELFLQKIESNRPIQELATNPLLLTLLCLVFDECGDFPTNRSELYREGLDVLLKKWDAKRNIERHQLYKNLSMQRKEDLLAQVAYTTFNQGDYFFRQVDLERYITDYIRNLPKANTNEEELHLDSAAIIKAIESQHGLFVERAKGIYSFSHLTFQEYLTARELIYNGNQQTLLFLASKISEERWQDVLRLAVSMMRTADELLLLMQSQCNLILAEDEQLQSFLDWVNQKASSISINGSMRSIRAFYLTLGRGLSQSTPMNAANVLARTLVLDLDLCQNHNLNLELAFDLAHSLETHEEENIGLDLELDLSLALEYVLENQKDYQALSFSESLKRLIESRPHRESTDAEWQNWISELREQTMRYQNIGKVWNFSDEQMLKLHQYCEANKLIVECLDSDCYLNQATRLKIEQNLLLPKSIM